MVGSQVQGEGLTLERSQDTLHGPGVAGRKRGCK